MPTHVWTSDFSNTDLLRKNIQTVISQEKIIKKKIFLSEIAYNQETNQITTVENNSIFIIYMDISLPFPSNAYNHLHLHLLQPL